jgi:hypothetical protein
VWNTGTVCALVPLNSIVLLIVVCEVFGPGVKVPAMPIVPALARVFALLLKVRL